MLRVKHSIEFVGRRTPETSRRLLRENGFVRVDGLIASFPDGRPYVIGEKLKVDEHGQWDANNSKIVFVTQEGEVWLTTCKSGERASNWVQSLAKKLGLDSPRPKAFVPLSRGEGVSSLELLERLADPDWGLTYITA